MLFFFKVEEKQKPTEQVKEKIAKKRKNKTNSLFDEFNICTNEEQFRIKRKEKKIKKRI